MLRSRTKNIFRHAGFRENMKMPVLAVLPILHILRNIPITFLCKKIHYWKNMKNNFVPKMAKSTLQMGRVWHWNVRVWACFIFWTFRAGTRQLHRKVIERVFRISKNAKTESLGIPKISTRLTKIFHGSRRFLKMACAKKSKNALFWIFEKRTFFHFCSNVPEKSLRQLSRGLGNLRPPAP